MSYKKLEDHRSRFKDDPAFMRWSLRLETKAKNTVISYLYKFFPFMYRYGYTPQSLYEARLKELQSNDPMDWNHLRDQILGFAREMVEADIEDWPIDTMVFFQRGSEDEVKPLSPGSVKLLPAAVNSFMETFSERMIIRIRAKDLPQGDGEGSRLIPVEDIKLMLGLPGEENPHRNRALILFLKDSGLRRVDVASLTVEDYLEARKSRVYNDFNEPFLIFEPHRTQKRGINAHIIVGPETVEALENYFQYGRQPVEDPLEPIFLNSWHSVATPLSSEAIGFMIRRCLDRTLGPRARGKSPHGLRKTHKTALEAGGVPANWINYLQGKARDRYSRPEQQDPGDHPEQVIQAYIRAYDQLRTTSGDNKAVKETRDQLTKVNAALDSVVASNIQLEQKITAIEAERAEDHEYDQALRQIFATKKGRQLLMEMLDKLEKGELEE